MVATLSRSTVPYRFRRGPRLRPNRSKKRRQTARMTPSRTVGHLVWAWPTPHIHGACSSSLSMLASDFGENMRHRSRSVARLLTVVILLATSYPWVVTGRAQTQGGITGTVTDSSGAAIPGATVTVTNTATRGTRNTTTNAEGLYTFPACLPAPMNSKSNCKASRPRRSLPSRSTSSRRYAVDVPLQVGALGRDGDRRR